MARRVCRLALWLAALGYLAGAAAACGLHPGGVALAFIRAGQLWTIQADGSNAHAIAQGGIVGFAWSPDHHQLVYRTTTTKDLAPPAHPLAAAPDAHGELYVTSINGGAAVQISPAGGPLARSDAWWDPQGNRLLYRESLPSAAGSPTAPTYIESQADQPLGIASKTLVPAASLPTFAPDGSRVAAIDGAGDVRVGAPQTQGEVVASGALAVLPDTSRPGRVLWQPGHDALLYATAGPIGAALTLHDLAGGTRSLASVHGLLDAAFSPDGALVLAHTTQGFAVWNVVQSGAARFAWTNPDPQAIAFWSPSGRYILVDDTSGSQLVDLTARHVTPLLVYASPVNPHAAQPPSLWHPATGSPWSADETAIVFAAQRSDRWGGSALPSGSTTAGAGLYLGEITGAGMVGPVALIDAAADLAPSWSYADPSTTLLLPS